jgi:hypothetical protein
MSNNPNTLLNVYVKYCLNSSKEATPGAKLYYCFQTYKDFVCRLNEEELHYMKYQHMCKKESQKQRDKQ